MARFKFRLATLLKLREATRDERRSKLAEAYEAERILQQQQEQLSQGIRENKQRARKASEPGTVDVDDLLRTHRHELILQTQQQVMDRRKEQVTTEIERRRRSLVEADRQVRILEKLRQRQFQRHAHQQNKLEMKQLDEVAGRRAVRKDHEC